MTETILANRLLIAKKGFKVTDIAKPGILSPGTLTDILEARTNVSGKSISKLDEFIGGNGLCHFNFALDRLAVLTQRTGFLIKPEGVIFPASIPADFQILLIKYHPIFLHFKNSENNVHEQQQKSNDAA